ncbi:MAG: MATE family efflux transporter [Desulfurococcaceae archaeon]
MESTLGAYRDRVINGPVGKTLLWLGLPLMAVQLVHVSYNIADAYWLSRYSEYAYAAPRQIWPFFMFLNAIAMGISTANTALISQAIGAKDYEYAKRVISYFITLNVLLNAAAATLFYLLRPWMFRYLINVPPEIYSYVMVYSAIVTFDLFIAAFTISYSSIFQSIGDTRTPSRIGVITAMMNIVLDPLMIFGVRIRDVEIIPSMGVAGAALATVLSRLTGLVLLLRVIRNRYAVLTPRLTLSIDKDWLLRTIRIGAPVTLMMMSNSLAFMFQHRLINSFGAYAAAAAAIGFILMDLADAALWGFTMSVATMIGQAIGAGLESRARKVASRAILYIGVATSMGSLVVYVLRMFFIQLFTNLEAVVVEADLFVSIFIFSLPTFAIFFIGMSIGRGSGHTLYPTILGIIRLWVLRLGVGYLLAFHMGMGTIGIWTAMSLSNVVSGLAIIPWALRGRWTTPVIKKHYLHAVPVRG